MSFKFMKLVVDWDGAKYNSRLEIGDESTTPVTPVDLRFKVPGYIENVHTVFFQNYASETNVPRIYGDADNLVFYDNHDTTNRAGVKLADLVGGGESLWESPASVTYLTTPEDIDVAGYSITNLLSIGAKYNDITGYDDVFIRNQAGDYDIAKFSYKVIGELAVADLDMLGHHVVDLLAADTSGHAVEFEQLGGAWTAGDILYASDSKTLISLPSSGAATKVLTMNAGETAPEWAAGGGDYVHPATRQCTSGSWAWDSISGIPSTLEYTTHKNVADGYCGIASDGYMPTIALLPSMIKGSLYVANNLNTMAKLPIGTTDGHVLTVSSSETLGVAWAAQTGGGTGLWKDEGTWVHLIQADNLSMQNMYISNLHDTPQYGTDAVNRNYVDGFLKLTGGTMIGNINMGAHTIDDLYAIKAYDSGGVRFKLYDSDTIVMQVAMSGGYAFTVGTHASMGEQDLVDIDTLKGVGEQNLKFYDDHAGAKTLSELAGSGLWEEVNTSTIRPKTGYTTIQGIDSNDLYIKPASGQILYLG